MRSRSRPIEHPAQRARSRARARPPTRFSVALLALGLLLTGAWVVSAPLQSISLNSPATLPADI